MADELRLLHLSDLHFQSQDYPFCFLDKADNLIHKGSKSYDQSKVNALVYWLYRNRDAYDAILITGDLAHTGHVDDLNLAHSFVNSPNVSPDYPWKTTSNKVTLAGLGREIIVLPGNHDRFKQDDMRYPGADEFSKVFHQFWTSGRKVRARNGYLKIKYTEHGLGVICADFTLNEKEGAQKAGGISKYLLPFNYEYLGQGKVTQEVLDELEEVTGIFRGLYPRVPVIWAIHFSFDTPQDLCLIYEEMLAEKAALLNIPIILSGHTHNEEDLPIKKGKVRNITAGSATSNCEIHKALVNSFQIINFKLDNDNITGVDVKQIKWVKNNSFIPRKIA